MANILHMHTHHKPLYWGLRNLIYIYMYELKLVKHFKTWPTKSKLIISIEVIEYNKLMIIWKADLQIEHLLP